MTADRTTAPWLNFEAEFDRVADAFLAGCRGNARAVPTVDLAASDRQRNATDRIYARALEIIDVSGVGALNFRALAHDLKMSTRTCGCGLDCVTV